MPLPKPSKKETEQEFVSRCMGDDMMNKDFKDKIKVELILDDFLYGE